MPYLKYTLELTYPTTVFRTGLVVFGQPAQTATTIAVVRIVIFAPFLILANQPNRKAATPVQKIGFVILGHPAPITANIEPALITTTAVPPPTSRLKARPALPVWRTGLMAVGELALAVCNTAQLLIAIPAAPLIIV
jgi:hypothetical protein